ncbi:hypothetical protein B0H11DRAFT_2085478 [Mycena galericulata]|nr:hypothetical protein B0H11DRAFT_2085478 [Mycena galericulata]
MDMDAGIHTRIEAVGEELLGKKLRVAGQVLAYDAYTGLAVLRAGDAAVVVDVTDCVSEWSKTWLQERFCTVTALGYLERAATGTRLPGMPKHVNRPRMDEGLVLRALLVKARADLEFEDWNAWMDGEDTRG